MQLKNPLLPPRQAHAVLVNFQAITAASKAILAAWEPLKNVMTWEEFIEFITGFTTYTAIDAGQLPPMGGAAI